MEKSNNTVFTPGKIGSLVLRNRTIRTGAFEGMTPDGIPSAALVEHHRQVAAGGVGLTTVAYCSTSLDGLTFPHQMHIRDEILPGLEKLTHAVHAEGAAASLQIGHAGYFASRAAMGQKPIGASKVFNLYTLTYPRPMTTEDFGRLTDDFVKAALAAKQVGFDAIELHFGHGYLLNQFLSPYTNRRKDKWGGSLENRLRFPLEIVRQVRKAVGPDFGLLAKTNLEDGFKRGLQLEEAIEVSKALEAEGVDALVLSGGFVSKTPFYMMRGELPIKEMARNEKKFFRRMGLKLFGRLLVQKYHFEEMFFLEAAKEVRRAVKLPLVLLGGIRSLANMQQAMQAGFDFVALGRPLILEPDLINKMAAGETSASLCEPCNLCVAQMEAGGIRCVHPQLGKPD
ncbi:MAG: NADH:flavin oxidoreductase [Deltaproteobacteria bacterium]|nr:NADH:flavin oxidoreductase [Deltaproteobacteria bacterium]